jgi:hypothetical protein
MTHFFVVTQHDRDLVGYKEKEDDFDSGVGGAAGEYFVRYSEFGGGVFAWIVVVDFGGVGGGMAGGKDCAGERVWVYRGCGVGVDWVGDRGMDFYAIGNCARGDVSVFVGGGDLGGSVVGVDCAFVFWGEGLGGIFT